MSESNDDGTELPEIVDDGTNNNYGEWETRSYYQLRAWDLLKYIEGPTSQPPIIPPLRETATYHGIDDNGHPNTVHVPGNLAEHEQAIRDAGPWMTGNNAALARIVYAIPSHQLYLVGRVKYAKQAWDSLRSAYRLQNSIRAATITRQIMSYRCQSDMNVAKWLGDMLRLRNTLCSLQVQVEPEHMSDRDFALAILDLMPPDEGWRGFLSGLRAEVRDSDSQGLAVRSATFITAIRDEYWNRHPDDYQQTTSHIFSARFDAQRRNNMRKQKRSRNAADLSESPVTTPAAFPPARARAKRARVQNPDNAKRVFHQPTLCL
jgi:gag-polypeptide of LTR copia-type